METVTPEPRPAREEWPEPLYGRSKWESMCDEIDRLRAEVGRLRSALPFVPSVGDSMFDASTIAGWVLTCTGWLRVEEERP